MNDNLRQDQEDFAARMQADPFFSDITVLVQRRGVTENDVQRALSILNETSGKIGVVAIVIMPELVPSAPGVPGPEYDVAPTVQVIEAPLFNLGTTGTGKSAEEIAQRIRQLFHYYSGGQKSVYLFAGMQPITVDEGQISYGVKFRRRARDPRGNKVALPEISANSPVSPATVTLTCLTGGAGIYYTTDGSYPSSQNSTATLYSAPFALTSPATLRAAAELSGQDQSDVAECIFP